MFWDSVAGVYDLFVNVVNARAHRALKEIVAGLVGPGDAVLECACGTGMLSAVIAGRCRSLTATDFSPKMLARARRNCVGHANIEYRLADITALDFPNASFDVVVAGNVIHLLEDPLAALKELDRVCKPGGRLVIPTYMNRKGSGEDSGFARAVGKAGANFKRQFTVDSYRAFFEAAGYRDVQIDLAEGRIPCAVAAMERR